MADFSIEELKQALTDLETEGQKLSQETLEQIPDHRFSPHFEKRMEKLLKQANRRPFALAGQKAAAVALTFLLTGTALAVSAGALQNGLFRVVEEPSQQYTDIRFDPVLPSYIRPEEFTEYGLAKVPEGFVQTIDNTDTVLFSRLELYFRGAERIFFTQELAATASFSLKTDGEGTERVGYGEQELVCFSSGGCQYVLWAEGDYAFSLISELPMDEVVALAGLVKKREG